MSFRAKITETGNINIIGGLIYIEIYNTDENGQNSVLVDTITKTIAEFNSSITLTSLNPKSYYYLKFRIDYIRPDTLTASTYLYDKDVQIVGRQYYFSTLATVGISNVGVVYDPVDYDNKTIDIKYSLERIMGYRNIEYNIYKYDNSTLQYELLIGGLSDTILQNNMIKKVNSNPGSVFEFGEKYKVVITPWAEYVDIHGITQEVDLGTVEYEFELAKLRKPIIGIRGKLTDEAIIEYRVTIYDVDQVIVGNKYTITILENDFIDITPLAYKNVELDATIVNRQIEIFGIDKTKSYTIVVAVNADYENSGTNFSVEYKTYKIQPTNSSGINIGEISTTSNNIQANKVDLIFNNSYKLTEIQTIRYTIYNTAGYNKSGTIAFIPTAILSVDGDTYYVFTLDEGLGAVGKYYMELQFLKNGDVIESCSLEHTYI